jgi:hypothetical protein
MQAFSEAAEGIRTLDLLHGKQWICGTQRAETPANRRFRGGWTAGLRSRN